MKAKGRIAAVILLCTMLSACARANLEEGLIGYWPLDEGTGLATADIAPAGYGHDGTLVDGPVWTDGLFGGALNFDGVDDYVRCAERAGEEPGVYPAELMPETFSVSCWTKLDAFVYFSSFVGNGMDTGGDECGFFFYNYGWVGDNTQDFGLAIRTETGMHYIETPNIYQPDTWYHLVATYDGDQVIIYVDGEVSVGPETVGGPVRWVSAESGNYPERFAIGVWLDPGYELWVDGIVDEVGYWNRPLAAEEAEAIFTSNQPLFTPLGPAAARNPIPGDGSEDVLHDVVLEWTPGDYAPAVDGHQVYLSTSLDDVNDGAAAADVGVVTEPGFDTAAVGLEFATTYYWRIDEANAATGWDQGAVWSFTTEPLAYPIETVIATSNGVSESTAGPENTVNGSGLDIDDQHSMVSSDMWLARPAADEPLHIQFEFDRVYKMHEMLLWNYNSQFELLLGFGVQSATVAASEDGVDWTVLGEVTLTQATASETYAANTTIDLGGAAARYIRLSVSSGYGVSGQFGLSEVRFMYIPAHARGPEPADGAPDVSVEVACRWRPGRDATSHEVNFGADRDALTQVDTVDMTTYVPGTLDLGTTYYWRVDAIGASGLWEGDIWSFVTQSSLMVEDFESYDDEDNRIYQNWIDGYGVDNNGSTVGHLESPFAERAIVNSGRQSMPLFYDNTSAAMSEAELTLAQDWTASGVKKLSLHFQGAEGNTGQLYVKINGVKVPYPGAAADIAGTDWLAWTIDLSTVAGNLSDVTSLAIGIEGAGASGVIYVDDIALHP